MCQISQLHLFHSHSMKRREPLMPVGNPVSWKDIFVFFLPISAFRLYHVENQQGCVTEPFFIRLFTRSPGNRRILPECRFCALHVLFMEAILWPEWKTVSVSSVKPADKAYFSSTVPAWNRPNPVWRKTLDFRFFVSGNPLPSLKSVFFKQ